MGRRDIGKLADLAGGRIGCLSLGGQTASAARAVLSPHGIADAVKLVPLVTYSKIFDSVASGAGVQVATIIPVVTSSLTSLAANAATITIAGLAFAALTVLILPSAAFAQGTIAGTVRDTSGAVLPGVVGGISLLLALWAFQVLPVNYAGLALIALGVLLMIAEFFVPSFGYLVEGNVQPWSSVRWSCR